MIVFSYPGEAYEIYLQTMAAAFGVKPIANTVNLPPHVGSGYLELVNLPMGIQALLADFTLADDLYQVRERSDVDFFTVRLEVLERAGQAQLLVDNMPIQNESSHAYCYMTSLRYTLANQAKKGLKARSLNLRFLKDTILTMSGCADEEELLTNSVTNLITGNRIMPASGEMLQILEEILRVPTDDPARQLKIFNRALLFIELFFERMRNLASGQGKNTMAVKKGDFDRIREVEKIITVNLNQLPPKQEELAALAHMSVSKLKYIFKAVHGTSIYHYYQKARMERALRLLQEGNTIAETADELGFRDLTNFTRNFKREFQVLPGKVRLQ